MLLLHCHASEVVLQDDAVVLRTARGEFCYHGGSGQVRALLSAPHHEDTLEVKGLALHWGAENQQLLHEQPWLHVQVDDPERGVEGVYLDSYHLRQVQEWLQSA